MSIGALFWVLMILWLLFGWFWNYSGHHMAGRYGPVGNTLLLFVLLFLLGWKAFGFPIHG
jgi:hypothetical protein